MSNTNYDLVKTISYSNAYRHYRATYEIAVPPYYRDDGIWFGYYVHRFEAYVSFDDGSETDTKYEWSGYRVPPSPCYNSQANTSDSVRTIPDTGAFSKVYFRNPHREKCTFTDSNCLLKINYLSKEPFEIKMNSEGYIGPVNASFKCSTVEKRCFVQYSWRSARVYYKKTTDSSYSYVQGTVEGTWSDITVKTNLSLETGYKYHIYILATADDGSTARTSTGVFETTDTIPVTTCVSPVGVYTTGEVNFVWSHATEYGTPQYAYDLEYSNNNGASWTTVASHEVSSENNRTVTINSAGVYIWRVRTYNTLDQVGAWAQTSFINNIPATAPTNFVVTTKGRPTASWVSTSQVAYQVQVLLNDKIVYDSGALYTGENRHFINDYFDDTKAYSVRARIYDALGNVSDWVQTGYQQPEVPDVEFVLTQNDSGGVLIEIAPQDIFVKHYIKRNGVVIAELPDSVLAYTDKYAVGLTTYEVVGVTSEDQSDIKSKDIRVVCPHALITVLNGTQYYVNKRVNSAVEIQTSNEADINQVKYIGNSKPAHFFNKMKVKTFTVTCFDDNDVMEELLGNVVFYADNFGNGGYCIVTAYTKDDNFIKNGLGIYANEVTITLEVTNYDDSIQYAL